MFFDYKFMSAIEINTSNFYFGSKTTVPVMFDLKTREAIWVDVDLNSLSIRTPNMVETNIASTENVIRAMLSLDNKPTLHDLLEIHAIARGEIVENEQNANIIYSLTEGLLPDINNINSNYLI